LRPIYLISKTPYEGVIHIPVLSIRFLTPDIDFSEYEGVVFTSKQGIEALRNYRVDWEKLRCICVSEPTAEYARTAGARNVEAASGYGVSIPDVLSSKKRSGRWLYLRPEKVASSWTDEARSRGFEIDEAVVYQTRCNPEAITEPIDENGILIFTSPSSVECFLQRHLIFPTHRVVVIGTTTQKALPHGTDAQLSAQTSVASAVELARQIAQEG
jgi:uroporphyrinogen-III synthase